MSKLAERSLILRAEEVRRALADGAVTVCRPVKLPRSIGAEFGSARWEPARRPQWYKGHGSVWIDQAHPTDSYPWIIEPPFGDPGSERWVKETWAPTDADIASTRTIYRADGEYGGIIKWRPSTYMPRHRSRLGLELTDVGCKQVHQITDSEVRAAGIEERHIDKYHEFLHKGDCAGAAFGEQWDRRYAKRGLGWDANPWIWVGAYRRATP